MTLGIWTLYMHLVLYGGSSTPTSSTIVNKFNTKEDCLNAGNTLIKKFSYVTQISSICVESNL